MRKVDSIAFVAICYGALIAIIALLALSGFIFGATVEIATMILILISLCILLPTIVMFAVWIDSTIN